MARTDVNTQLVVRLLGHTEVRRGAQRIPQLESGRLLSLLAYLIVERGHAVPRQRLAFELWPDSTDAQARTNLRHALHHLRHALGDSEPYLLVQGASLQWRPEAPAMVDVVLFESAATTALAGGEADALDRAAAAYGGELLPDCYDDWVAPERNRLRSLTTSVLRELASTACTRREWTLAVAAGERLLRIDPTDEAAHRLLIRAHASAGERVRALRQYGECVAVLDREFGVAPDADTAALHDELMVCARPSPSGDEPFVSRDRVPLIGRETELRALVDAWDRAARGESRFMLVIGEPGIGKSRLVEELVAASRQQGATAAVARAYEAGGDLPYGPIVELLQAAQMQPFVAALEPELHARLARALPTLLDVSPDEHNRFDRGNRAGLFEAIAQVLVAPSRRVVVAIDDLHWCDPDTLELLEFVLRAASTSASPLLLVGTIREEELASDPALRHAISRLHRAATGTGEIALGRLAPDAARHLVETVLGPSANTGRVEHLITAADGNPLFLLEMARTGLHGGAAISGQLGLPPGVHAVIDMRLATLSHAARELVAAASVVGRSFTMGLIDQLMTEKQSTVAALDELWRRGIIRERGVDSYDFTHDRIRDVAYHRLGPAQRHSYHAAIARALTTLGAPEPGQLAYHLERSGEVDAAVAAYRRTVEAAARAFAHQDVIAVCRRALRLVATRQPSSERDEVELAFLVPLGVALMAGPGVADDDLGIYRRASSLRHQRGLAVDASTLRLSANAAIGRRQYRPARHFGRTLLARGIDERDAVLITEGHYLIGVTSFWLGELDTSRRHLEMALDSHDARRTAVHLERFGQDPRSVCLVRLALARFHVGDERGAADAFEQAMMYVGEVAHEYTEVYVRTFGAWYLADSHRSDAAARLVDEMPTGTPNSVAAIARLQFMGWRHTTHGDPASGVRLLSEAAQLARGGGSHMFEPYALMLLARSRSAMGDRSGAVTDATAALAIATSEMPFHVPEATRLAAEFELAHGGDPQHVLDRLETAALVANRSGTLVHELRARTSMLRLARAHAADAVDHVARALTTTCAAMPPDSRMDELVTARHELAHAGDLPRKRREHERQENATSPRGT